MVAQFIFFLWDKLRGIKRARTPTRIQMEAVECGSTALMIIMAYYNKYAPAAELRHRCGVSRDGSNAFDLVKAAEYYGFRAEGYYTNVDELRTEIDYPAIAFWENNHFIVVEGIHKETVYINDPNTGPEAMDIEEFRKHYAGVLITFELTDKFKMGGVAPKFLRPLVSRMKNQKGPIAALMLLHVLLIFTGIAFAVFSQIFIDAILTPPVATWVGLFLCSFLALTLVNFFISWIKEFILNRMRSKISISLSLDFFWHVLRLPLFYFHQRYIGEIMRRMNLNVEVAALISERMTSIVINIFLLFIYLLIVYQYDRTIGLVTLAIVIYNILALFVINEIRKSMYAKSQQVVGRLTGVSIDSITNIESIHLMGSEPFIFQRLIGINTHLINTFQKIGSKDIFLNTLSIFTQTSIGILILALGGWRVMHGDLTAGMFISLQILISRIMLPINELVQVGMQLPLLRIDLTRIDDLMMNAIDPLIAIKEKWKGDANAIALNGEIALNKVSFGYQPLNEPLIQEVSFKINPGEIVGITGPNGCGKSTIMRLIAGQYCPLKGEVLYSGYNIQEVPLTVTKRTVAVVENEALFIPGTLRENLTLWNPYIKEEHLIKACQDACIHHVIEARRNGYNYVIDEGASDFSQGQKQRLDIARALLFRPTILILDEALNGLEKELIKTIYDNIKSQIKTVIVVSHHETVLSLCDRVLFFQKGKLVRDGPYER